MELGFRIYSDEGVVYVSRSQLTGQTKDGITTYTAKVGQAEILWTHTPYAGGWLVELTATAKSPLGIRRIDSVVCTVGRPEETDHISVMGRSSLTNEIRFPHEFAADTEYCQNVMGHFRHLNEEGLIVVGVSPFQNVCSAVAQKDAEGNFVFCVKTEFTDSDARRTCLKTERAYYNESTTIDALYSAYRALLPQSSFPMPKLTGWNSWDYYLSRVTAEDIFENVAALQAMPFADRLRYIVIDDGWQKGWGLWEENEKFACGLKAVADRIREAGFVPGIWMAPLAVRDTTAVYADHPQWLCRTEDGELLKKYGNYYLDPTNPEARAFILDNYRYQYEAGYRLFKMDFVSPLLAVRDFYDKQAAPYGVLSQLVKDVQAHTGPDALVLGCSLPLECGADITPSMRCGLDIHNHFSHVGPISRSIAWASVYNNKTTRIDPDFLIVRGEDTATEPLIWEKGVRNDFCPPPRAEQTDKDRRKAVWRHGDQFSAIEAETWATMVALSGGNLFLSDRMSKLNARGIGIIEKAIAMAGDSVRPVYLHDDHRTPSLWIGDKALAVVNWEESARCMTVSGVGRRLVSDKPFRQEGDTLTVTLQPHECFAATYATE